MRIGNGFDVHALVAGRRLVLGGVVIPYERGLDGHSDADVLLHAVCDAFLGALALGDIGMHFPDSEPRWKDADSRVLLRHVVSLAAARGYRVGNLDVTLIAQAPKMAPYVAAMRSNLAADLGCDEDDVSVKATTTERLGFTGRGEGIAAMATVRLRQSGSSAPSAQNRRRPGARRQRPSTTFGSHVVSGGQSVIIASTAMSGTRYGATARAIRSNGMSATFAVT